MELLAEAHPAELSREAIRARVLSLSRTDNLDLAVNDLVSKLKKKLPSDLAERIKPLYRRGYKLELADKASIVQAG